MAVVVKTLQSSKLKYKHHYLLSNSSKPGKLNEIRNLNENVFNLSPTQALLLNYLRRYAQRKETNGWWLLQLKEAGRMSKGARLALLAVGRASMADGRAPMADGKV